MTDLCEHFGVKVASSYYSVPCKRGLPVFAWVHVQAGSPGVGGCCRACSLDVPSVCPRDPLDPAYLAGRRICDGEFGLLAVVVCEGAYVI